MPAVQEADPKPAAHGKGLRAGVGAVLGTPRTAWRWGTDHPRARLVIGAMLLFTAVPLLAVWVLRPSPPPLEPPSLDLALAELDRGHDAAAREMVKQLEEAGSLSAGEEGGPAFVLGVVTSRQADRQRDDAKNRHYLLAARYLIESQELGFPADREPQGLFLLGKSLLRAGQWDASQEALEAALPLNPEAASEIERLLCDAYLNDVPPNLDRALKHNTAQLADPSLAPAQRYAALLQRAAILLRLGRYEESRAALEQIPVEAEDHLAGQILAARILEAEGNDLRANASSPPAAATQKYEAAYALLQSALEKRPSGDPCGAPALYQLGVVCQALGRVPAAKEHYTAVQVRFPAALEALAAGVQEAELLRLENRDEEALETYRRVLGSLRTAVKYANAWMILDELRQRLLSAYQRFFDAGKYEQALHLVQSLTRLVDSQVRLELAAAARRAWGQALMAQAERAVDGEHRQLRHQAETLLRAAGHDFDRLAQLRFTTREYPDDLWASSECFLQAHDAANSRRLLENYLQHEPSRRRPLALVRLGEALLLENRPAKAIEYLQEAINVAPGDSSIYRGRILAGQAHLELNDTAAAEKLLLDNLASELLTPASLEWRDSLFALGRLLYLTNRYLDAIGRLEEAVRRYPQAADAIRAHYLIGESYRQLARKSLDERDAALVESARNVQGREAHRLLEGAIAAYESAAKELESRRQISQAEQLVLRNCRYMKGAALFDMGRYEEAAKAYSTAINHYQQAPEVLDAYVRVADCFRRLRRPLEARGTIEQAKTVLARLPESVDFSDTSSFDRQEWRQYLEWLGTL